MAFYGTTTVGAAYSAYAPPTYAAPVTTYTAPAPAVAYAAPVATPVAAANVGGVEVVGEDKNLDGIPDVLETPVVAAAPTVTYGAPAVTYAAPAAVPAYTMAPAATYAAPAVSTYGTVKYAAQPFTYASPVAAPVAAPLAAANVGGVEVVGEDKNLDGIPDALETPIATAPVVAAPLSYAAPTAYTAPMVSYGTQYAAPTVAPLLQTAPSMFATGPFQFTAAPVETAPEPAVESKVEKKPIVTKKEKKSCCS